MQNSTDHPSIEKYSDQFADIIINDFFINKGHISGQEILDLTPVKQINLFVIKTLLFEWKKESVNLRSPYFDYSHEEVQQAQAAYMNTVSRHISVDEESLKPLLVQATYESILLIFFPYVFYTNLIEKWEEGTISVKELQQIGKYIKINKSLIDSLINEIESKGAERIEKNEALKLFNSVVEKSELTPADTDEFEHKFDQILSFHLSTFTHEAEVITSDREAQSATSEEPEKSTKEEVEESQPSESQDHFSHPDPVEAEESADEPEVSSLHDTFQEKDKVSLADVHQRQKIEKISRYISINQKFMFINRLFDKDWGKFEKTISFLDETNNKEEIVQYLDEHAPAWREEGDEADEFRLVLEKKLGVPIV